VEDDRHVSTPPANVVAATYLHQQNRFTQAMLSKIIVLYVSHLGRQIRFQIAIPLSFPLRALKEHGPCLDIVWVPIS